MRKLNNVSFPKERNSLPLKNFDLVPAVGKSGGLWLIWGDSIRVHVLEKSHFFMSGGPGFYPWILGAIYGDPHGRANDYIWDRVVWYATNDPRPLFLVGDFNCITGLDEKQGGSKRNKALYRRFTDMISRAGLLDLGYHGPAFTWSNKRAPDLLIRQRLDRALALLLSIGESYFFHTIGKSPEGN
jgi:hypothetical protein